MAEYDKEPEAEAEEALDQASPAAVALALGRAGKGARGFDDDAQAFLRKHTRLIDLQVENLHETRELSLSHLRWRRFSDRMKALLQVMTAVVALFIAIGVGWMAWSASQERGLVIEPFSVPPDLAQKGMTGQVVASMLLDKLGEMQSATDSFRSPSTYANNWNDQIKVEIPETGVSVGELRRLMVRWLGHQTTISGELYRTPAGLAIAARTGTAPAKSHPGAEGDVEAMVQAAAEDVYGATQPYRYAIYLSQRGDRPSLDRGLEALRRLGRVGDRFDRIWALNGLGTFQALLGDLQGAIASVSAAIALDPSFCLSYGNRGDFERWIGHDEAALAVYRTGAEQSRKYGRRYATASANAILGWEDDAAVAALLGDFAAGARDQARAVQGRPDDNDVRLDLVLFQARGHDVATARDSAAALPIGGQFARLRRAQAAIAVALDDWAGVRAAYAGEEPPTRFPGLSKIRLVLDQPYLALASAKLGDIAVAQTLISATPADCYLCLRVRGQISALASARYG